MKQAATDAMVPEKTRKTRSGKLSRVTGGRRKGSGRKAFAPTEMQRAFVKRLARYEKRERIAEALCISLSTLVKYFPDEISEGMDHANSMIAESLYEQATKGDLNSGSRLGAGKFWLSTRAGWTEKHDLNITHSVGGVFDEAVKQAEQVRAGQAIESAPMVTVGSNGHANGANGHGSNGANGVGAGPVIDCDFEEIE